MREVRVTVPQGKAADVARLALDIGLDEVSVYQIFVRGAEQPKEVVSAEISTPNGRRFVDAVVAAPFYNARDYSVTVRTIRSVINKDDVKQVTQPCLIQPAEIWQELWQYSHATVGFAGRITVATCLLAYAMLTNNVVALIAALMFAQYLPPLLAVGFGTARLEWRLVGHAALVLGTGTAVAVAAGAAVAAVQGGPLRYEDFGTMTTNLVISLAVGFAAALATADDIGDRQLIGLAAAAQFAKFPIWFGISLVLGFPDAETTTTRLATFAVNAAAMVAAATLTYLFLVLRRPPAADR